MDKARPGDYIQLKVVMTGNGNVGKSSLLHRYVTNTFADSDTATTIAASFYVKSLTVEEQPIKLQLWDTAGQERFRALAPMYFRGSHGLVVVFDLTDKASFESLKGWIEQAHEMCTETTGIPKVLIGNKSDLERRVSYDTAKEFADQLGMPYIETSAKTGTNVEKAFYTLASEMKKGVDAGLLHPTAEPTLAQRSRVNDRSYFSPFCGCQ